jgi:4-hydroxybenzoate polyprenyltransferase
MRASGGLSDWADLVRLPSVLTVPGDVLLGAFAAGPRPSALRVAVRSLSSSLIYLAGMALNDWADRHIDARERPSRPIPSGRVSAPAALALASGLTAAGLAASRAAGGAGSGRVASLIAGTAWAYDLGLKHTPLGPAALSTARYLNVMHGAGSPAARGALAPAAVVAGHILGVGLVSRHEAEGGTRSLAHAALAGTACVSAGALAVSAAGLRRRPHGRARSAALLASLGCLAAYAGSLVRAEVAAAASPGPAELQRVVGAGVLGLVPLQASLLAALGPLRVPAALGGAWLAARRLARRRAVT